MKKYFKRSLILMFLLGLNQIFGQTLYNKSGVSVSYSYNKIGEEYFAKCKTTLDKYQIIVRITNSNSKAINWKGIQFIRFKVDECSWYDGTYSIAETSTEVFSFPTDGFLDGRYVDLLPNGEQENSVIVYLRQNKSFPSPSWQIDGFDFFEVNKPVDEPKPKQTEVQNDPEYSEWKQLKSPNCDFGIEYCTKRLVRYKLNYQLWFYYKVRNTSNKNISFTFNLTKKGKKEFSQGHNIGSGGTDEFMHKMSGDYIDGVSVSNVLNTETNKDVCDDKTSSTDSSTASNAQELINEMNELCTQLQTILNNSTTNTSSNIYNSVCKNSRTYQQSEINIVKTNIKNLKTEIERLDKNTSENSKKINEEQEKAKVKAQKQAEEEAARKQKAIDDQREQYTTAIQNGDSAMGSKQYSSAMSYYSNAKSYAQNSSETAEAERKYQEAYEAKKTAERTERVAKVQAQDKQKDAEYAGLTAGFVGLAALLNDSYSPKWYAMKFQLGLGYESFPLISNNVNKYHADQSYIEKFTLPTFHLGFKSGFFNNKGVSLEINPQFNLGFSALSPGKSGGYTEYGSTATLYLGKKGLSKVKLFAEAGYFKRSGRINYDYDAANTKSDGTLTTNSDDVREGTINYGKIKYGAGIMFRWINDIGENYIRPSVFYEKASFFESDTKPVLGFNIQANIASEIIIEITYAKNYFIGGEVKFPSTLVKENQNFWGIKLIRQGKLF